MLATEHSLLRMFLNIWCQIWFPEDLHDASLYNICIIEFGTFDCPRGLQFPARLTYYQCTFNQFPARLTNYQCTFTQLQGVSNLIVSIGQFSLSAHYASRRG